MTGTPLEMALLGLVAMHPQSGYDLRSVFDDTPMGQFSSSPGSVYPALRRMDDRGWLEAEADRSGPRERRVYSVTDEGRVELARWLREPVTVDEVRDRLDTVILRFSVAETVLERQEALAMLEQIRVATGTYLEELEEHLRGMDAGPYLHPELALEQGVAVVAATREWAVRASAALAQAGDEPETCDEPET